MLLGHYTKQSSAENLSNSLRLAVCDILGRLVNGRPVVAVLGNHDVWSGGEAWNHDFKSQGIRVLTIRLIDLRLIENRLCLRGLGDTYSGQFEYTDWPDNCADVARIMIAHDPAGAS